MITQPLISSWKESLAIVGHAVCIHPQCRLCFLSLAGKNILLFVYLQEMSYVPAVQEWLVTTRTARAGRARQTTSRARTAARGSSSSARYRRTTRSVTTTCSGTKHYRHVSRVTFSCSATRARVRATARAVWRPGPGAARPRYLSRRTSCPGTFTFRLIAS